MSDSQRDSDESLEQKDALEGIRRGIADVQAGRTTSLGEFERQFRIQKSPTAPALTLDAIEEKIQRGIAQLDPGEGIPEDQLDAYLAGLKVQPE